MFKMNFIFVKQSKFFPIFNVKCWQNDKKLRIG